MAYSDIRPAVAATASAPRGPEDFYGLGVRYSTGRGVPFDLVQAHMWFNLAAMRGIEAARRSRKELSDQMSTAQIAAAQRAAREWLALAAR